ncbi:MAG: ParA family protein [Sphingomonadaceae bacterium]|nr:ParA family protein [Sphingomonadaceae bacterium]
MATIAIYSMKGGVGKTTLGVNLAWVAATRSSRRTLLWDLDGQAAATFILAGEALRPRHAREVIEREVPLQDAIARTATPRLDLLPADRTLHGLDTIFAELDKKKRLRRLAESAAERYDHVVLDCPPGLGLTSEQVIRGASLIVVPIIPSPLAWRAFEEVRTHLDRHFKHAPPLMPVFNMVDRRRASHRAALADNPSTPAIPMASAVEAMGERHAAIGAYAPRSPAAAAIEALWKTVERRACQPARAPRLELVHARAA